MESRTFTIKEKPFSIYQNLDFQHAGIVWDAAISLIKYMEKNYNKLLPLFEQKNIIELGTGTGIIGLCLDEFNPKSVILTDMKDKLAPVDYNLKANQDKIKSKIATQELLWGNENEKEVDSLISQHFSQDDKIDIVIGSDLNYVKENTDKLFETFEILYKKSQNQAKDFVVLLAYTVHKPGDDYFLESFKDKWNFEPIKYREYHKDYRSDDIGIVFIKPKIQ